MNEAREILKQDITGCTIDSKGKIKRVWFSGIDQYYLDTRTRTIKAKYNTKEYAGISANAVKIAIRRAKKWRANACSSE